MDTKKILITIITVLTFALCYVTSVCIGTEAQRCLEAAEYELKLTEAQQTIEKQRVDIESLQTEVETYASCFDAVPTYNIPLDHALQCYTYEMCRLYNIEDQYEVVLAMMWHESRYVEDVISSTNDYGIMQINEFNHSYLYDELGIVDIMDPRDNIHCGVFLFSSLMHRYDDVDKALMAYNMGPTTTHKLWTNGTYSSMYSRGVLEKAELIKADLFY